MFAWALMRGDATQEDRRLNSKGGLQENAGSGPGNEETGAEASH